MTRPVSAVVHHPPSPPKELDWGSDARSASITPGKRIVNMDRSSVDPAIVKAAQGLESLFIDYMMQSMRKTIPKNDMDLESGATDIYRSMLDGEMARRAAESRGIGLTDQIIAYLMTERYNNKEGHGAPPQTSGSRLED